MKYKVFILFISILNIIFSNYKIIDNKIYFNNTLVQFQSKNSFELFEPDSKTFEVINDFYAKDKYTVYYGSVNIIMADPATFELFAGRFSKDKNNVYRYTEIIGNIDSNTVLFFDNQNENDLIYLKDKNGVYIAEGTSIIKFENVDAKNIQIIGNGYVLYNRNVYYKNQKIEDVDLNTFEISKINSIYSKDKNCVYYVC